MTADRVDYPWDGLEDELRDAGVMSIDLAGYGSLLNAESARTTIPDTPPEGHPPIMVYGATRIFNYEMPGFFLESRYGLDPDIAGRAALNSAWTGRSADSFNARLLTVAVEDIEALRCREVGYDLAPITWRAWDDPDAEVQAGYTLCATKRPVWDMVFVNDEILPCEPYLELCRVGARGVSAAFEEMFLDSTLLADGRPLRSVL